MTDEIRTIPPKLTKKEWNALLDHSLIKEASYIIYTKTIDETKYYYALNGTTGIIDYSGTSASAVIQSAWEDMSPNGGCILLKGEILLDSPLTFAVTHHKKQLVLRGEGIRSTRILWRQNGTAITIESGDPEPYIGWDRFLLEGFQIDCGNGDEPIEELGDYNIGNGYAGRNGIALYRVGRLGNINDVWIRYADVGIFVNDTNTDYLETVMLEHCITGIKTRNGTISIANAIFIRDSKFTYCDKAIDLGTGWTQVIEGGVIEWNHYGIYSGQTEIKNLKIASCHFEFQTYYDICLEGNLTPPPIDVVEIENCYFLSGPYAGGPANYSIKLDRVFYTYIHNIFSANHTIALIETTGYTGSILIENYLINEPKLMDPYSRLRVNSGTATILSGQTSVTFAHGLAGIPTIVTLGATHAEVADAIWSADGTNITITVPSAVTANRNISWYTEVKP